MFVTGQILDSVLTAVPKLAQKEHRLTQSLAYYSTKNIFGSCFVVRSVQRFIYLPEKEKKKKKKKKLASIHTYGHSVSNKNCS